MKKILLLSLALLSATACRLDLKPDSELTYNGFWSTEEALNANHVGMYGALRGYTSLFWRLGEVRSDVWGGKTLETPNDQALYLNNISATSVPVSGWGNMYSMIHNLNDFIKNAPTVPSSNVATRNHMMGQAYGLRAYLYLTLLKTFGDVPISTEPLTGVTDLTILNKPRSPKADVAKLIKEDIQKSLDYFGSDNSKFKGKNTYWSRPATLALQGEAYLFFGNVLGEGTPSFQIAKDALSKVSGFSLASTYAGLWGVNNEGNPEFIFAIDYQQNQAQSFFPGITTGLPKDVNALFDRYGKTMNPWVSSGSNRYGASEKLLNAFYNNTNDSRGDATFIYLYADSNGGAGYSTYNADKYRTSILKKFMGEIVDGTRQAYANFPVYRYADVLLMLAEAKNLLGEDPSAEINAVRKRAFGSSTAPVFVNSTKDANTQVILNERFKEFVGEGKRWWDLQRAGSQWVFKEVPSMTTGPIAGDARKIYLPITQNMISTDPNLKQTEGY